MRPVKTKGPRMSSAALVPRARQLLLLPALAGLLLVAGPASAAVKKDCGIAAQLDAKINAYTKEKGIAPDSLPYKKLVSQLIESVFKNKNWDEATKLDALKHLRTKLPAKPVDVPLPDRLPPKSEPPPAPAKTEPPTVEHPPAMPAKAAKPAPPPKRWVSPNSPRTERLFNLVVEWMQKRKVIEEGDVIHVTTQKGLKGIEVGGIKASRGKFGDYGDGVYAQRVRADEVGRLKAGDPTALKSLTEHGRAASNQLDSAPEILKIVGMSYEDRGPTGVIIKTLDKIVNGKRVKGKIVDEVPIENILRFDRGTGEWFSYQKQWWNGTGKWALPKK